MLKRIHILVRGTVQGVYYRHNTQLQAMALGLTGWVRNLPYGPVEIVCEGSDEQIRELIDWCRSGPRGAQVEGVDIKWEDHTGEFSSFEIKY